ncbi:MCE family protein [Mycobacterium sp. SMC-2]|uniref:MCE family protein n=1 Tax=Mycobacterium sp. SMC-2 TaxID=2857058 RepID=UPI0021B394F9|nr:MCE family protein [Mycobacterium sp. SMC-2]UXA06154.1 MCE family protein [Mycobacterium sp. SMC-2]
MLTVTGCTFTGLNSLPLPGVVGRGPGASVYHVEIANIGTLESNSPVMINNVVVGSVGSLAVQGWHADVEISVKPGVVVPANAVARVGQTSLLGSMHLSLDPPLGQRPTGRFQPGATIPLNRSSTYPSTEQTLASLSAVVNAGGLGQIGDIIHNFNAALSGREGEVRELLSQLDKFIGVLNQQRGNIIESIQDLNRFAGNFAEQRETVERALERLPRALEVLIRERPRITTALDKLRVFSDTATGLVDNTKVDLVKNLKSIEPAVRAIADIGPDLDTVLAYAPTFPYTQDLIDRAVRGDYMNMFAVLDLTVPRVKRTLLLGTRWGEEGAKLVPAPGEPWYLNYTYAQPGAGVTTTSDGRSPAALMPPGQEGWPWLPDLRPNPSGTTAPAVTVQAVTDFPPMDEGGD